MTAQQATAKETVVLNGVNVGDVEGLVGAIQDNPDVAKSKFRLRNTWINGGHNRSKISGFYAAQQEIEHQQEFSLDADEPPILAGGAMAPTPWNISSMPWPLA